LHRKEGTGAAATPTQECSNSFQFGKDWKELERIRTFADKLKGDGWAQGRRRLGRKGTPYYIGKWQRRGAKFCACGRRDGTNGMVSGKTLDCFRQLKRPREVD
jgi:hypothetical protein